MEKGTPEGLLSSSGLFFAGGFISVKPIPGSACFGSVAEQAGSPEWGWRARSGSACDVFSKRGECPALAPVTLAPLCRYHHLEQPPPHPGWIQSWWKVDQACLPLEGSSVCCNPSRSLL